MAIGLPPTQDRQALKPILKKYQLISEVRP
jgi:hypothetical protein